MRLEFPFGRDKFTLDQLLPFVPRVARHLRRRFYNRTRRQIKQKIFAMNNIRQLMLLRAEFIILGYGYTAFYFIADRLDQLVDPNEPLPEVAFQFVLNLSSAGTVLTVFQRE